MPGGLGPFGGNKLQTLPMHFKTHQCHIKGGKKKMFPLLSVHGSFHLGEPDAISYGSFYCCKLIPNLCWDFSRIHRHFQMGMWFFSIHRVKLETIMTLRGQDIGVEIPTAALVRTPPAEIYSRTQRCQSCHSPKTRALPPPNPARNPVVLRGSVNRTRFMWKNNKTSYY